MLDHKITKIVRNVKNEKKTEYFLCPVFLPVLMHGWDIFVTRHTVAHDCLLKSVELRMRSARAVVTCAPGGEGASVTITRSARWVTNDQDQTWSGHYWIRLRINVDLSRLNLLNTKVIVEVEVIVDTGSGNWLMLLMTMSMTLLMMTEPPSPGQGS